MRPRSADFLERDDDDDVGEFRYGRAAGRLRPKSSMAQCGWEDEGYDEDEEWRASALATTPAHVTTTARHGSYGEPQQPTTSSGGAGTTQNRKVAHVSAGTGSGGHNVRQTMSSNLYIHLNFQLPALAWTAVL